MTRKTLITLGAVAAMSATSQAAIITNWDFSGVDYTGAAHNSSAAGQLVASSESGAVTNLTSTGLIGSAGIRHSSGAGTNDAAGELNLNLWGTLDFTLTADAGFTVDLTSISISAYRNGAGAPANFAFQVNVDGAGFVAYDTAQAAGTPGAGGFTNFTFTDAVSTADGGNVVIRFAPNPTSSTGNIHINGLSVDGAVVAAVPEPSSTALLGLGGLALILRRRK